MSERIPTNLRTLLILEVIGGADHALTPTQINDQIGLPKQTVHRLVNTLVEEGFLIRDPGSSRVRPSRRTRLMGAGILHASRANIARHQILQDLANEVGEAVNYVIPEEDGMKYLDRVETDWPFRIQLPRGTNVPFHTTASGKTFMSSLKPKARKRFVEGLTLKPLTPNSHLTPESLLTELSKIAKQGFAVDNEEFIEGLTAVAVPVMDDQGRFVAAIGMHGPKLRLDLAQAQDYAQTLRGYATKLQNALFSE